MEEVETLPEDLRFVVFLDAEALLGVQPAETLPKDWTLPSAVSAALMGISGHGVTPLHEPCSSLGGGEQSASRRPAA